MPENKTLPSKQSVAAYIESVENATRRADAKTLLQLMNAATGEEAVMWGPSQIGFGCYHYKYDSGHEGDFFKTGFAPRKANMVVYIMPGFENYAPLLAKLGKHKIGKSCLYLGALKNVDLDVLAEMVERSYQWMGDTYD